MTILTWLVLPRAPYIPLIFTHGDGQNRVTHFVVLKGQYTSKLLLGLENILKTKVFTCIKKIKRMRIMRYRIMKKAVFWYF